MKSEIDLKQRSRDLRRNMTDAERCLWSGVRAKHLGGFQFNRQKVIGDYIADFYCHKARLVIEVDGPQHQTQDGADQDRHRDEYMKSLGISVMRFANIDVLQNTEAVLKTISETLGLK